MQGSGGKIAVIGAGLAGLTAALDLAEAGRRVVLIERRPFAGGKAFSFTDPRDGAELDNGQHITMRCCTALEALLERIGLRGFVEYQDGLRVPVFDPGTRRRGEIADSRPALLQRLLRRSRPVPAPFHLAASVARYPHLSAGEKARLGFALRAMRRDRDGGEEDGISFADWLRGRRQSERAVANFWDLIVRPTCNDVSADVSAAQALQVFRDGFLSDPAAADIGLFRGGLSRISEAALERFAEHGGEARFGWRARALVVEDGRAAAVDGGRGERIEIDAAVLALPPNAALRLLPDEWRERPPFEGLARFSYSPIVNVHMRWDREIMRERFAAVLDDDVQFVFNRTLLTGDGPAGQQRVSCSLSAAREQMGRTREEIARDAAEGVRRVWPAAREAELLDWRVVVEREATFRALPGMRRHRIGPETPLPNLSLAGAWTATGWPATLESAVRSGHAAAALLAERAEA